jgi:hypothetical protein
MIAVVAATIIYDCDLVSSYTHISHFIYISHYTLHIHFIARDIQFAAGITRLGTFLDDMEANQLSRSNSS